jgi:hypothetical protein
MKVKIVCDYLNVIMVPLPECASGEWGPAKAYRLFSLVPISHENSIINCGQYATIKFKMLKPLIEFIAVLKSNKFTDRQLQQCTKTTVRGEDVTISLELPDEGKLVYRV